MTIISRWTIPVPSQSVQTFIFGSANEPLSDRLAYIDANRPDTHFLTQSTFRLWSKRLAVGLQRAGLQSGDRVLIFSGNHLFYPVSFMGVLMAGGVFTGANPTYVARELAHQLSDSGALFLLTVEESLDVALEAAASSGMSKDKIFIFDDKALDGNGQSKSGVQNWSSLLASAEDSKDFIWQEPESPKEALCCLNYSSGTTGVAKGVMITHANHVANSTQTIHLNSFRPNHEERQGKDRWLSFLPMYHAYGQSYFVITAGARGIPVFLMPKFDFIQMLECIQKFKITTLILVPPIAVALAKHPATKNYDLSSVIEAGSGAAPLSRAVCEDVEKLWPDGSINVKQGWGMTECTCSSLNWDPRDKSTSFGVGQLSPNCEARIVDESGTSDVAPGTPGELWVRGPNVMKGYWKNTKATAETLTPDSWLKTGDICYRDEKGVFYIVDRRKELIKVKGLQVAPAELEAVLLEHPDVADAGVVGVTIEGLEMPRAYLVAREGSKVSGKEIEAFMKERVSRHKMLTGGIVFTDVIPKNPSGKILRKLLRERAVKEVGGVQARL